MQLVAECIDYTRIVRSLDVLGMRDCTRLLQCNDEVTIDVGRPTKFVSIFIA